MANRVVRLPIAQDGFGKTLRRDAWWAAPAATAAVLIAFIVYATFRAFEDAHYAWGPYLSPFYSPYVPTAALGLPFLTPAMLILPGPASFRLTCYYYRKAYYRSFAMDPPACAVGEPRRHAYHGERRLLVFQNLHRFALYLAIAFLVFLWHDFVRSLVWPDGLGVGVGSLVLLLNVSFLSLYTFSCHSFRHLIGGGLDSFSTAPLGKLRHKAWSAVGALNAHHARFAWVSLLGVALTDLYVRQVASGAIRDVRLF